MTRYQGNELKSESKPGENQLGRAYLLRPGSSDFNLLRYGKGIIDLDTKIPDGALDFGMPEQQLNRTQVTSAPVDQGCLCSP